MRDVVRDRILRAAVHFTHKEIAARMTRFGTELAPDFRPVSRQKVDDVIAGRVSAQLEELDIWAMALEVSPLYLLGFTWDPTPAGPGATAIVPSTIPGALKRADRRLSLVPGAGSHLPRHLTAVPDLPTTPAPTIPPDRVRLIACNAGHPSTV